MVQFRIPVPEPLTLVGTVALNVEKTVAMLAVTVTGPVRAFSFAKALVELLAALLQETKSYPDAAVTMTVGVLLAG